MIYLNKSYITVKEVHDDLVIYLITYKCVMVNVMMKFKRRYTWNKSGVKDTN